MHCPDCDVRPVTFNGNLNSWSIGMDHQPVIPSASIQLPTVTLQYPLHFDPADRESHVASNLVAWMNNTNLNEKDDWQSDRQNTIQAAWAGSGTGNFNSASTGAPRGRSRWLRLDIRQAVSEIEGTQPAPLANQPTCRGGAR
jgi:hypothetical protein